MSNQLKHCVEAAALQRAVPAQFPAQQGPARLLRLNRARFCRHPAGTALLVIDHFIAITFSPLAAASPQARAFREVI